MPPRPKDFTFTLSGRLEAGSKGVAARHNKALRAHVKKIVDAVNRGEIPMTLDGKSAAAVILGRKGGLKGGPARAKNMTAQQRSDAARKAALARWGKHE